MVHGNQLSLGRILGSSQELHVLPPVGRRSHHITTVRGRLLAGAYLLHCLLNHCWDGLDSVGRRCWVGLAGIGHRCWDGLDGIGQRRRWRSTYCKGDLSVPQNAGTLFMLRLCRVRLRVGLGLRLLLVRLDYCQRHRSLRSDWWVWLHGWCLLRRTVGLLEHSVRLQCWCCISLNTRRRGNWVSWLPCC